MNHGVPATRSVRRSLQLDFTESEACGAPQRALTSARAATSATLSGGRSRPDAEIRAALPSLRESFAGLQVPDAAGPESPVTPRAHGTRLSTLPQSPGRGAALPSHRHSTSPTALLVVGLPRTPKVVMSPGAAQSPCQNKSFDRINIALTQLGLIGKLLEKTKVADPSLREGYSVIYHLKIDEKHAIEYSEAPIGKELQVSDASGRSEKNKSERPNRNKLRIERPNLINLHIELHLGGGLHSGGINHQGSYVKVDGNYIDDCGTKQKLVNRVGRFGAFLPNQSFNHELINRAEVGRAREERGTKAPRRKPVPSDSPGRLPDQNLMLLAMVIIDPKIVNNNLTDEWVSEYCAAKMASAMAMEAGGTPSEFPAQYKGLMKILTKLNTQ